MVSKNLTLQWGLGGAGGGGRRLMLGSQFRAEAAVEISFQVHRYWRRWMLSGWFTNVNVHKSELLFGTKPVSVVILCPSLLWCPISFIHLLSTKEKFMEKIQMPAVILSWAPWNSLNPMWSEFHIRWESCWETKLPPPQPACPAGQSCWALRRPPGAWVRTQQRVHALLWRGTWSWPSPACLWRGRGATWPGAQPPADGTTAAGTCETSRQQRHRLQGWRSSECRRSPPSPEWLGPAVCSAHTYGWTGNLGKQK